MASAAARLRKLGWGVLGFYLFVVALELLKTGAGPLAPVVTDTLRVTTALDALGFGWILASIVLSGSPVAAVAITFFAENAISAFQAFAMIAGSRLGAAFVVLLLGYTYHLRDRRARGGRERSHDHATSLELGVLSLLVTFAVYTPALPVGWLLLRSGLLAGASFQPVGLLDVLHLATAPVAGPLKTFLPAWVLLLGGFGLLIVAFQAFDRALPDLRAVRSRAHVDRVFRPTVAFAAGFVVTTLTLSVSVSLGLLVPLAAKGYVRRENVVPYIMGANVSTFIDTLVAAILLGDAGEAVSPAVIVLAEMLSVALVSLVLIVFAYRPFERLILASTRAVLASGPRLTAFVAAILAVPLLLLLLT